MILFKDIVKWSILFGFYFFLKLSWSRLLIDFIADINNFKDVLSSDIVFLIIGILLFTILIIYPFSAILKINNDAKNASTVLISLALVIFLIEVFKCLPFEARLTKVNIANVCLSIYYIALNLITLNYIIKNNEND